GLAPIPPEFSSAATWPFAPRCGAGPAMRRERELDAIARGEMGQVRHPISDRESSHKRCFRGGLRNTPALARRSQPNAQGSTMIARTWSLEIDGDREIAAKQAISLPVRTSCSVEETLRWQSPRTS